MRRKELIVHKIVAIILSAVMAVTLIPWEAVEVQANEMNEVVEEAAEEPAEETAPVTETPVQEVTETEEAVPEDNNSEAVAEEAPMETPVRESVKEPTSEMENVDDLRESGGIDNLAAEGDLLRADEESDLEILEVDPDSDEWQYGEPEATIDGKQVLDELIDLYPKETAEDKLHPYGYKDNVSAIVKRSKRMLLETACNYTYYHTTGYLGWNRGYFENPNSNPESTSTNPISSNRSWYEGEEWYTGEADLYRSLGLAGTLAFLQPVPMDITGCGMNNYIAYYGIQRDEEKQGDCLGYENQFYILNTHNKKITHLVTVAKREDGAMWQKDDLDRAEYYGRNFTAVTAGDFNGDGKDSLITYHMSEDGFPHLSEIQFEILNNSAEGNDDLHDESVSPVFISYGKDEAFDPDYLQGLRDKSIKITSPTQRLGCSLAAGDVNGDGIEDLVVVSSQNGAKDNSASWMTIYLGGETGKLLETPSRRMSIRLERDGVGMCAAGVDIGDINGDHIADIMVSGIKRTENKVLGEEMVIAGYSLYHGGEDLECWLWAQDAAYWQKTGDARGNAKVTCIAFDGQGRTEHFAVDGRIYKYNGKNLDIVVADQAKGMVGYDVGNFAATYIFEPGKTTNEKGAKTAFEQFSVSHMFAAGGWFCDIYYGNASYDDDGTFHPTTKIVGTSGSPFSQMVNYGKKNLINLLMVPYESADDEAFLVRLTKSKEFPARYVVKGPIEPIAILQAAPYFTETGSKYAGSTAYGLTEIQGDGETDIGAWYAGIGLSESLALPFMRQSASVIYKHTTTTTITTTTTQKWTSNFTATSKDTVLVRLSPTDTYTYDTKWGINGQWQPASLGVTIKEPTIYKQITVDEYNAMAGYYNKLFKDPKYITLNGQKKPVTVTRLEPIDKEALYLGHEGEPDKYAQTGTNKVPPLWESISKMNYTLGYQGGSTTSIYSKETTTNTTTNTTDQVDLKFDFCFGATWPEGAGGLWVGPSIVAGLTNGDGTVKITGNGEQISGTVKNLNSAENASFKDYSFDWRLGRTTYNLRKADPSKKGDKGLTVPVVGYSVGNVKKGLGSTIIRTLRKFEEDDKVKVEITWDALTDPDVTGYIVKAYDIDGNCRVLGTADHKNSWIYERQDNESFVAFTVTPIGEVRGIRKEGMESRKKSIFFLTGPQGDKGDKGDKGETGPQGEKGDQGTKGDQGPTGPQGEKGETGPQGDSGEKGEKGDKGEQGEQGPQGEKGDKGDQGIQGEKGDQGDQGEQGPQGEKGDKGDQGIQGEKGDKGDQGEQGIQGDKGDKGDQGIQGEKGEKGDRGEKGDPGAQGIRGIDGKSAFELAVEAGFVGDLDDWLLFLRGKDGIDGKDGRDGADGADGKNGKNGRDGYNGRDGQDGTNGRNGKDGRDGIDGANGIDGKDGVDGKDGRNGRDGRDGADGANGADGRDGKSAYDIAVDNGFVGTEKEWLESLKGRNGIDAAVIDALSDDLPYIFINEDDVLIVYTNDGKEVEVGFVESTANDNIHYKLKSINPDAGIKGFLRDWLPLILALISLVWNAVGLVLILTNRKRLLSVSKKVV